MIEEKQDNTTFRRLSGKELKEIATLPQAKRELERRNKHRARRIKRMARNMKLK